MIRISWRIILWNQNHFLTPFWNQNDIFRFFDPFWLIFDRLRFSLLYGVGARQYTQNDRKGHLCPKMLIKTWYGVLLTYFKGENDNFAHLGNYLEKSRNLGQKMEVAEISAICQKFLDQYIQNFIPHLFHMHQFFIWAPEGGKLKKFEVICQKFLMDPGNFWLRISEKKIWTDNAFIISRCKKH